MKDVASHTATDIQELLAIQPKDIMMSLDQRAAAAAPTSAESKASQKQSHRTSTEELGKTKARAGADRRSIIPIPREATSVATMMGLFPVLNSLSTQSRSFCCLSPWIASPTSVIHVVEGPARSTYTKLAIRLVAGT